MWTWTIASKLGISNTNLPKIKLRKGLTQTLEGQKGEMGGDLEKDGLISWA